MTLQYLKRWQTKCRRRLQEEKLMEQPSDMSNPKPSSHYNIHHCGIQIVRELSKVRIAPTIAVKESIPYEAYKVRR